MTVDHSTATELIKAAHKAVAESSIPKQFEETAFAKAFDFLARDAAPVERQQRSIEENDSDHATQLDGSRMDKIAARLKLPKDVVNEVFYDDGEALGISLGPSRFDSAKARAAKQIAFLVAAGRQAGGWDTDWTQQTELRRVCDDFGKFDSKNFATTIGEMTREFGFSGSGAKRKVKVNRQGYEDAANLVRELVGGDQT
jgi:hypothetical protein